MRLSVRSAPSNFSWEKPFVFTSPTASCLVSKVQTLKIGSNICLSIYLHLYWRYLYRYLYRYGIFAIFRKACTSFCYIVMIILLYLNYWFFFWPMLCYLWSGEAFSFFNIIRIKNRRKNRQILSIAIRTRDTTIGYRKSQLKFMASNNHCLNWLFI